MPKLWSEDVKSVIHPQPGSGKTVVKHAPVWVEDVAIEWAQHVPLRGKGLVCHVDMWLWRNEG